MAKTLKPGQSAPRSGVYEIVGPRGSSFGKERIISRGEPFPPTPKSGRGYKKVADVLVTKSGRFVIASPAKSTNTTVADWTKAFEKKWMLCDKLTCTRAVFS